MIVMTSGGLLVGYLLAGLFGRRGWVGWLVATLGGALATMVSGLTGSLFWNLPDLISDGWQIGDIVAVVAGALVLPFALNDWPLLVLIVPVLIFAAHVWARKLGE